MTNAYVSLDILKSASVLNISGAEYDNRLLQLAEAASRAIDRWCNRHFFLRRASLRFDGDGGTSLIVPDLISVDDGGVRTDHNGSGTYQTVWGKADYILLPTNADASTHPYTSLQASDFGGKHFPAGKARVQIAGNWGWWERLRGAAETANAVSDATTSRLTLSTRTDVSAGHTLLIDTEQIYVRVRNKNTITAIRGVNGTTATAHSANSAIHIYEYPPPIAEAALMLAARLWRSTASDIAAHDAARSPMDADIAMLLSPYRKIAVGVP